MAALLIKKRKEEFFKKFQESQSLMISLENEIINYKRDDFPNDVKRLFITVNKNCRIEMRRIFQHQTRLNLEPNYIMLNGVLDFQISEMTNLSNRLHSDNFVEKAIMIFNSRMRLVNQMIFSAGTKDPNDIYSQADGSEDWELIKYYTEEIIPNTEENTRKSCSSFSKNVKALFLAVVNEKGSIPDSNKDIKQFIKVQTDKILRNKDEYSRKITSSQEIP